MPTQEVDFAARPNTLLHEGVGPRRLLLDGGSSRSWGDGLVVYTDEPLATLEVFSSGWGRCCWGTSSSWRRQDPFDQWEGFLERARTELGEESESVGVLSVFAYDLKHWVERLPRRLSWPDHALLYCAIYDWRYEADRNNERAVVYARTRRDLARRRRLIQRAVGGEVPHRNEPPPICPREQMGRDEYERMIDVAHEYIAAGDIYQVNLAQRFDAAFPYQRRIELFDRWTRDYAMPFAAFVEAGSWSLASNSPECFLTVDGDKIATHPIKGTRRVDGDRDEPGGARQLSSDPKERAEHVMIVDLERNDLGRVCIPGSVEVSDFLEVHDFPVLSHMISEVRGRLKPGMSAAQIMRATFPGGSITGAPKVRAMQIIEELEPTPRGFYTGAIGWSTLAGRSRFNLAIRTAFLDHSGLRYHAGGGIVADSSAAREYEETFLKSESLFHVLNGRESNTK